MRRASSGSRRQDLARSARTRATRRRSRSRSSACACAQFRGESQFSTWLHRLVVNTCRDVHARRRLRSWEPLEDVRRPGRADDPARAAALAELRGELASLPGRTPAGAGARRRPEGRVRLLVRGDLGRQRHAGRDGEVLRAPRARPPARAARPRATSRERRRSGATEIEEIIPHREPFLLLDEVLELEPGARVVARKPVRGDEWYLRRPLSRAARSCPACSWSRRWRRPARSPCSPRRRTAASSRSSPASTTSASSGSSSPGDELDARVRARDACAARSAAARRRATVDGELAVRGTLTFAVERSDRQRPPTAGAGLDHGPRLPRARARATNDELATLVDTSDEWIVERTGHPRAAHRRAGRGAVRLALPAARAGARARGRRRAPTIDLLIVATVTPDMALPVDARRSSPTSSARPTPRRTTSPPAAPASCTRSRRRYGMIAAGLSRSARSSSAATCSRRSSTGPTARRCVLFGDGAGAVVLERGRRRRLPRLRARRGRRRRRAPLRCPGSGSRRAERRRPAAASCR